MFATIKGNQREKDIILPLSLFHKKMSSQFEHQNLRAASSFQELHSLLHHNFFPSAKEDEEFTDNQHLKDEETLSIFLAKTREILLEHRDEANEHQNDDGNKTNEGENDEAVDKKSVASDGPENESADLFATFFAWFTYRNENLSQLFFAENTTDDGTSNGEEVRDLFIEMFERVGNALTANRFIDCFEHMMNPAFFAEQTKQQDESCPENSQERAMLQLFGTENFMEALQKAFDNDQYILIDTKIRAKLEAETGIEIKIDEEVGK